MLRIKKCMYIIGINKLCFYFNKKISINTSKKVIENAFIFFANIKNADFDFWNNDDTVSIDKSTRFVEFSDYKFVFIRFQ